jgi:spore coat protein H
MGRAYRSWRWTVAFFTAVLIAGCGSSDSTEETGTQNCLEPHVAELAVLRISIDPADLDFLYQRDVFSDDPIAATAWIGDDPEQRPIQIRFRGSSSRALPKKSFNIRFAEGQELLFGSSRMNANAMYTDPAMMREHLAWRAWRKLGRPASRTRYTEIWINDVYEGLYIHIERVDADLLREAGLNPAGTLVRDEFRDREGEFFEGYQVTGVSAFGYPLSMIDDEETQQRFLSQTFDSRGNPDWSHLANLLLWVERSSPGPTFAAEFPQRFDLEVFVDWLALHLLIGDIDSFADDYWLYLDHHHDYARWIVIPWDKDLSFGSHWRPIGGTANDYFTYDYPVGGGWPNGLITLFLETPETREVLAARMRELMSGMLANPCFSAEIDAAWEVIQESVMRQASPDAGTPGPDAFVRHPANHHSVRDVPHLHMEAIRDFIELRYAYLDSWPEPPPGIAGTAVRSLRDHRTGDTILFTDGDGWTIARLTLLTRPRYPGQIQLTVHHDAAQQGVDRVWTLRGEGSPFEALLTFYYRNELPGIFSGENWYTGGLEAIGQQWDLVMAQRFGTSAEPLAVSNVNPFSNKVEAAVRVDPRLAQEFVLAFR